VKVTVKNGDEYEGIFHASSVMDNKLGVCLKMARKAGEQVIENLIIRGEDVCSVSAVDVEFSERDKFQTDTAISGHSGEIRERELRPWTSDDPIDENSASLTLDSRGGRQWDQFATNEKLFGVTTDYREEIYTTELVKSDPEFRKREARAAKIARDIETVESME
jgi:PAB1-binding protein PBP1